MALPLKRTLGDMRGELQTRLGFGMSGQAGIVNSPLADSFLRSAQEFLYTGFEWRELEMSEERLTGADQRLYDYPDGCTVEALHLVAVQNGGRWQELEQGISLEQRSTQVGSVPLRYERFAQMEIWPVPQGQYLMRREFTLQLNSFSASSDRTTLPSEMVFLLALRDAKAHYRQPDAADYKERVDALFTRLRARNRGRTVWHAEGHASSRTAKARFYSYPTT